MARTPSRIGRYDLVMSLATGGMGRIFLGRATGIGGFERKVVIKTLEVPPSAEADAAAAMFLDEARLLGLMHHQHIASVFEVGRDDEGRHYMVLDYVEGFSAHDVWERAIQFGAALPLDFSLTVVSAAANGLHYAHTRKDIDGSPLGIVHRDVTPSNVMVGHDGAIKLIDFGIAMAAQRKTKTQTGFVKGKVGYLSPEQVAGREVDARTDVFALGILLYELTTLTRAFRDTSDLATMQRIKQGKVSRPSKMVSDYPMELEAIVMKALQVDPRDRFNDADALRRAVEALGHRMHFVLGDAAIIEVMAQLFDPQVRPPTDQPASRMSDPAFEWTDSDHDLTVRRDPKELLALMRAENGAVEAAKYVRQSQPTDPMPRKLRAATEAADALLVAGGDTALPAYLMQPSGPPPPPGAMQPPPMPSPGAVMSPGAPMAPMTGLPATALPGTALPLASPPPTPQISVRSPGGRSQQMPAQPTPVTENRVIGASLVQARTQRRRLPLQWIAVGVAAVVLGLVVFLVLQDAPAAVASSPPATTTSPAPVAARMPAETPTPPMPTRADPPPTAPAPRKIRVQITTRPGEASVILDGKRIGRTPFDEQINADPGKHVIKLRRRGYQTSRLDVSLDGDVTEEVELRRGRD